MTNSVLIKTVMFAIILLFAGMAFSQTSKKLLIIEEKLSSGNSHGLPTDFKDLNFPSLSLQDKALYQFLKARYYESMNLDDKAYSCYLDSKNLFIKADSLDKAMDINLDIAYLLRSHDYEASKYAKYIQEYFNYAKRTSDPVKLTRAYGNLGMLRADEKNYIESLTNYKKALSIIENTENNDIKSGLYNNIANLYNENLKKPDSGLVYLKKDLQLIRKREIVDNDDYYHNYINQASAYHHKKDYKTSNKYLSMTDSLPIKNYVVKSKLNIYDGFHENYAGLADYRNAYKYLLLSNKFRDSLKAEEQKIAINDIQTKYQTKEKEVKNLRLSILLYTFIGLLAASLVIGFLIIKNTRRKEKIARQEKLIEQQQFEKTLKDYELNSIDMMLEGQEKERQRLANDLHDNLGSMLATLKLNFEHLKLRKNELRDEETKLYERTDELIEEAYQKVRRLAHAKNVGVLANEGLIPALKKLADKISIPGQLQIHVVPFGFDERIENTLEIAIFRMIQELSTNIIKHAEATEATIHLTHHENNINIIVEDNGKGFDSLAIETADGMGITSIKKKTEQLGGTMTIDSTAGKGTTIIIDIPV